MASWTTQLFLSLSRNGSSLTSAKAGRKGTAYKLIADMPQSFPEIKCGPRFFSRKVCVCVRV